MLSPHLFTSEPLAPGPQSSVAPKLVDRHPDTVGETPAVFSDALEKATDQQLTSDSRVTATHQPTASSEPTVAAHASASSASMAEVPHGEMALESMDPEQAEQAVDDTMVYTKKESSATLSEADASGPVSHDLVATEALPQASHMIRQDAVADTDTAAETDSVAARPTDTNTVTEPRSHEVRSAHANQQVMSDGEELLQRLTAANRQLAVQSAADENLADGNSLPLTASTTGAKADDSAVGLSDEQLAQLFSVPGQSVAAGPDMSYPQPVTQTEFISGQSQPAAGRTINAEHAISAESIEQPDQDGLEGQAGLMGQFSPSGSAMVTGQGQGMAAQSPVTLEAKSGAVTAAVGMDTQAPQQQTSQPLQQHTLAAVFSTESLQQNPANPHALELAPDAMPAMMTAAGIPEAASATSAGITADMAASTLLADSTRQPEGTAAESASLGSVAATPSSSSPLHSLQAKLNEAALANNQPPLQLNREQAGDELAERMQMMMSKNLKHVDIRLDPPELGRLQIKLSVNNDQASVQFTVGNQQTRDLVEQAMPRLRELLQQQGLQLAQSSVQQDSSRQFAGQSQQQHGQSGEQPGGRQGQPTEQGQEAGDFNGLQPMDIWLNPSKSGVDYYA